MKKTQTILELVKITSNDVFQCKLSGARWIQIQDKDTFKQVKEYLKATDEETAIFVALMQLNYTRGNVNLNHIADFFAISAFEFLDHHDSFDQLLKRELVLSQKRGSYGRGMSLTYADCCYSVAKDAVQCIIKNQPLGTSDESFDSVSFVNNINDFLRENRSELTISEIRDHVNNLEEMHSDLKMVEELTSKIELLDDRIMFYIVAASHIASDRYGKNINELAAMLYGPGHMSMVVARSFKDRKNDLLTHDFLEMSGEGLFVNATLSLSDKGLDLLLGDDADLYKKKDDEMQGSGIIKPDDIEEIKLFFDDDTDRNYNSLKDSLMGDNFKKIQERLKDNGFPIGVTVILYGQSGTGKTESVYQIAKATGRKVLQVDIAQSRSCWYGESEKIIQRIFDKYKIACEKCERTPILLFNECDGIFSRRRDVESSNTAQVENSIQNIILQNLEDFSGILFATTNLIDNIDPAMDRRFLMKMHFGNPTEEAKKNIWQSKMPTLSDTDATMLARSFDFSPGEIVNIARKTLMSHVISGSQPTIEEIVRLSGDEKVMRKGHCAVGFK